MHPATEPTLTPTPTPTSGANANSTSYRHIATAHIHTHSHCYRYPYAGPNAHSNSFTDTDSRALFTTSASTANTLHLHLRQCLRPRGLPRLPWCLPLPPTPTASPNSEMLVIPWVLTKGEPTATSYSGFVQLDISGTASGSPPQQIDAFYVFVDSKWECAEPTEIDVQFPIAF